MCASSSSLFSFPLPPPPPPAPPLSPLLPDLGPPRRPRHEPGLDGSDRPRRPAGLAAKEHDARARVAVEERVGALAAVAEDVLVDVAAQRALEGLGCVFCFGRRWLARGEGRENGKKPEENDGEQKTKRKKGNGRKGKKRPFTFGKNLPLTISLDCPSRFPDVPSSASRKA